MVAGHNGKAIPLLSVSDECREARGHCLETLLFVKAAVNKYLMFTVRQVMIAA